MLLLHCNILCEAAQKMTGKPRLRCAMAEKKREGGGRVLDIAIINAINAVVM